MEGLVASSSAEARTASKLANKGYDEAVSSPFSRETGPESE
jgi:hypothetical protein